MNAEVVVVGGGLAGSAAAIRLARAGRDVVVIERSPHAQHKVCGEFLSREALNYLELLGLQATSFGAVPIGAVRLACKGQRSEAKLPFQALSLTRRRLDEELLRLAVEAGARVLRGCQVRALERDGTRWRAVLE
ncbi:MAG: FAD-dependent oxidoreductase, partial [Acidobacteriaceae bacterium]